jgi:hypothetical protein
VYEVLQVLSTMLVSVAMTTALAHALESPGKRRLDRDTYLAVQPIYYPGFTIAGGIGDVGGLVATTVLLLVTPAGTAAFWLTLTAVAGLVGMFAVYGLVTHPVNKVWLEGETLTGVGARFFAAGRAADPRGAEGWMVLRDRWEYSHVGRAVLAVLSLLALVIALQR